MNANDDAIARFHKTLRIALRSDALLVALDILIKLAELLIRKNEKERAVEILIFVMQYPLRPTSRGRAEALLLELEAELCPRVLADARALAEMLTLDELAAAIAGADEDE